MMAFTYDTRDEATDAAALMNVPEACVSRDHDSGKWGFPDVDESEGSDEPEGNDTQGKPEAAQADPADRTAEPGDEILQLGGPMLPAMSSLEAERLAKKLGLTIIRRNAITMEIVGRVQRKGKGEGKGGSSIERDERGLTQRQGIFLDMVMRPQGATNRELVAAGATSGTTSISWQYVTDTVTLATKGRFAKATGFLREEFDDKGREVEVKAFRMKEVPEAEREAALARVKASMDAKGQTGKKAKSAPAAVTAPEPKADEPKAEEHSNDDNGFKMAAD